MPYVSKRTINVCLWLCARARVGCISWHCVCLTVVVMCLFRVGWARIHAHDYRNCRPRRGGCIGTMFVMMTDEAAAAPWREWSAARAAHVLVPLVVAALVVRPALVPAVVVSWLGRPWPHVLVAVAPGRQHVWVSVTLVHAVYVCSAVPSYRAEKHSAARYAFHCARLRMRFSALLRSCQQRAPMSRWPPMARR